jgi:hypothetical protein
MFHNEGERKTEGVLKQGADEITWIYEEVRTGRL